MFERIFQNISYLKALIAADSQGYWEGHLLAVLNLLSIFRECERIRYSRYASYYLETIEASFSSIQMYMESLWRPVLLFVMVQHSLHPLTWSWNKQEQESVGDVIGKTRQVLHVLEWQRVYHEILALSNGLRELSKSNLGNRESDLHHELSGKDIVKIFHSNSTEITK